ncbi:flagellar type III secretion system protein FlhB [Paracoccus sp. MC1862]|uniref:flagellar type III secretion system protein FlhB n=1 Tax=Paracoccus sp. MC1862 TaxID=2760307 RepID=UPI00160165B6|nr:flagellar type III secretion system protein FlhB [Paracoccus sp. MC1862]MBB1498776.1 flagellar biosynthesis protein FlhB [Paracoccus sp. MC1862]QQO43936.1 flagellar biosynthesis protein FlhB [Paracoccus sp. MC1862]
MSGDEDKDDRQHEPSEQKLRRAREKGDIPRSAEATTALAYLGFLGAFILAGATVIPAWLGLAQRTLGGEPLPESADALARSLGLLSVAAVLGTVLVPAALVLAGLVIQRGLVFTPLRLAPDLKRVDPFRNAAQKFGRNGLVTFAISLAKLGGVAAGGALLFATLGETIAQAARMGATAWTQALPILIRQVLILALAVALVFAGVDLLWKHFDFRRRNRMTRKEVEDEHKDSEGDPHLKAARRQKAVDLALGSMLADVERADVVIVNPTHYAVALEWKRGSGRAPVCLAKGVDEVAARIRQRARDHKVPVWSDPPCARALHATLGIGDEITHVQFGAVAAAIRFAEAMRAKARRGYEGDLEGAAT